MVGQGQLDSQVEPDEAPEEEAGGGVPDARVLLRPDGGVPKGVLEEGRHHLQVINGRWTDRLQSATQGLSK